MGTLGQYLKNAREARDIDIRDAAQQTRISINYLKALEEEDFTKLPGEVFVKGFLKNYGRFLKLDEAETLKLYAELKPQTQPTPAGPVEIQRPNLPFESKPKQERSIEPFIWGAVIFTSLLVFLFTSLPVRHPSSSHQPESQAVPALPVPPQEFMSAEAERPEKVYLEVIALEDTWLLVRTDTSPQKKAVLKKGESLIWSADERFLLSYGKVSAVKLLLNGEELIVKSGSEAPIRDLAVTRAGILNQPLTPVIAKPARPKTPANPVPAAVDAPRPKLPAAQQQAQQPIPAAAHASQAMPVPTGQQQVPAALHTPQARPAPSAVQQQSHQTVPAADAAPAAPAVIPVEATPSAPPAQ